MKAEQKAGPKVGQTDLLKAESTAAGSVSRMEVQTATKWAVQTATKWAPSMAASMEFLWVAETVACSGG